MFKDAIPIHGKSILENISRTVIGFNKQIRIDNVQRELFPLYVAVAAAVVGVVYQPTCPEQLKYLYLIPCIYSKNFEEFAYTLCYGTSIERY